MDGQTNTEQWGIIRTQYFQRNAWDTNPNAALYELTCSLCLTFLSLLNPPPSQQYSQPSPVAHANGRLWIYVLVGLCFICNKNSSYANVVLR